MNSKKGIVVTYILVFGSIFLILLGGILSFILFQLRTLNQRAAWNSSLYIAEAGINYYRWCINHGIESSCSAEKDYPNIGGSIIGHFSVSGTSSVSCGETIQKNVVSEGYANKFPETKRRISIIYARESVAKYSYIIDDNVWVGEDHEIRGPFHSNGGIRMDGENQSTVGSAQENWICTSSFGCSSCPTDNGCWIEGFNCVCPGVFTTANGNPDLFSYPIPNFDFNGITVDLAQIKSTAQTSGIYLPPSNTIDSRGQGYHLIFGNDGAVEVRIITDLSRTYAYSLEEGWHYDYFTISSEYTYNTYAVPSACSAIFVEDNLWPEGEVKGKITVASADLINPNNDTDIVLEGSIDYTNKDGSCGLTLIGERNVLIGPDSPDQMELRGIFIAQKGRFGRNHYLWNIKSKLEISGAIVSNGRVGTKWVSGSIVVSGYLKRETYSDPYLLYGPSVFTPYIDPEYKIINWQEL